MEPRFYIESPYQHVTKPISEWYWGDLHVHTVHSDGLYEPHQIKDFFQAHGYQFIAFSDHPDDSGVRSFDLDSHAFMTIPAYEFASQPERAHLNCIGSTVGVEGIYPAGPDMQGAVDLVNNQGGLAFFCHPFVYDNPQPAYVLRGLCGLEVINTGSISYRAGQEDALRKGMALDLWDELLTKGERVWGFVNSDFHWFGNEEPCVARNVVAAPSLTRSDIMDSLRLGAFYASTGLSVDDITIEVDRITVAASKATSIRFIGANGTLLQQEQGPQATYHIGGHEQYVRVELWGDEPAFTTKPQLDFFHQAAFLQPVFICETRSR